MGLDQWLYKKQKDGKCCKIGYWRKFNALHRWFVENCGKGVDECQEIRVNTHDLRVLLETLKEIDDAIREGNERTMQILMPPCSGDFFGSTNFDNYYKSEVRRTIPIIEKLLNEKEEKYYYQASW